MTIVATPRAHAARIKVLIVDDHAVLRQALKMLLEAQSEVDVVGDAQNGREALEAVERLHPDVVLMDMVMPGLNGLEATRQIRRRAPKAKVLMDTGHHYQGTNIEQIVAWLLRLGQLGGFHFNDRKYADDDLTLGSIDPYQVFRIFPDIDSALA